MRRPVLVSGLTSRRLPLLGVLAALAACRAAKPPVPTLDVRPGDDVQALFDTLSGPARVSFAPGDYRLEPVAFEDPSCGNCTDPAERVPATRGLLVSGTGIELLGASARSVALHTDSGYGVLFDGCAGCRLSGITVADGARDPDGRATDAGVVIRNGAVTLEDCVVRDNLGDSAVVHTVVVGIAGIAVREGGVATVRRCLIERNSWDGIAAYRGAELIAQDNVVDGVDRARGARMGGGRGTGIGVTGNARATLRGNLVTRYWKGIGVFADARADVEHNVVEDLLAWGIAYWGADEGRPFARIRGNVVFDTGACGVIVERRDADAAEPGELVGNVLVRTGQDERYDEGDPYCAQRPIARHAVPAAFRIEGNVIHDVRQPGSLPLDATVDRAGLRREAGALLDSLAALPHMAASRALGAYAEAR